MVVGAAGAVRHPLQRDVVEARRDDAPLGVPQEAVRGAVLVEARNRHPRGRAHPDRVDPHPLVHRALDGGVERPFVILAVRDDDDLAAPLPRVAEPVQRHFYRPAEVGARHRNQIRLHRIEEQRRRRVVEGERALHERLAGERHQSDPIAVEPLDQPADGQPGRGEAAGGDVPGLHRRRQVERHHDVLPRAPHRFDPVAELRAGERGRQQRDRREPQHRAADPAAARHAGEPVDPPALPEAVQGAAPPGRRPPLQRRQPRQQQIRVKQALGPETEHQPAPSPGTDAPAASFPTVTAGASARSGREPAPAAGSRARRRAAGGTARRSA